MNEASVRLLALDLGAETGRAVVGSFDGDRLAFSEVHRFPNQPRVSAGALRWDARHLYAEMLAGMRKARPVASVGIDTWGVDFGLLDASGQMVGGPVHYRDQRTEGVMREAFRRVPRDEIYERTGIQFLAINTLYQLLSMVLSGSSELRSAHRLLTMPALFNYWLTGVQADELTAATTTQCYDPLARDWASVMLEKLGIPTRIFGEVVAPGTELGTARGDTGQEQVRVIAPGTHDTASAVAAVPFQTGLRSAYISSGTWSLVGLELGEPVINQGALEANVTNEGGVEGTFRLLKNVMGLWLLQECRRTWLVGGLDLGYDDLLRLAERSAPFVAVIDPDDERLLRPRDMPARIASLAAASGQAAPEGPGEVVRCILESLALKYRLVLDRLEQLVGWRALRIHIVGGGAANRLLCQMTADACEREVVAGPVEATAIGNLVVQAIAIGLVPSLAEGRELVRRSVELRVYEPRRPGEWEEARQRLTVPTPPPFEGGRLGGGSRCR